MARDKIRVGLIGATAGAERWGYRAHIPALKALPEVELTAVCTAHKETAEEARRQTGAKLAFWDYREMVQSKEVDLVSVVVRIPLHFPMVMAALEAGKHVFCEWPLAMDASQSDQMHKLALQKGVYHGVGTQARFSPGVIYAKELLDQEYVGKLLVFHMTLFLAFGLGPRRSDRWWSVKTESGGGALNISCGHALDVLRWCLGEVEEVWGTVDTLVKETRFVDTGEVVPITASDTVVVMPRLAEGIVGIVHISNVCQFGGGFRLEVYGTRGA